VERPLKVIDIPTGVEVRGIAIHRDGRYACIGTSDEQVAIVRLRDGAMSRWMALGKTARPANKEDRRGVYPIVLSPSNDEFACWLERESAIHVFQILGMDK
jgi:hypothetical protein